MINSIANAFYNSCVSLLNESGENAASACACELDDAGLLFDVSDDFYFTIFPSVDVAYRREQDDNAIERAMHWF